MSGICICAGSETRRYETLTEAYDDLNVAGYWRWNLLGEIVRYNVCYRDFLRQNGYPALEEVLTGNIPSLKKERRVLAGLRKEFGSVDSLAGYDIQGYDIGDRIKVFGHEFHGLGDISAHCELGMKNMIYSPDFSCPMTEDPYKDIHIGLVYEDYPKFDSSDDDDERIYGNYIFRHAPITEMELMEMRRKVPHTGNFCMVHEKIPFECLPLLFYPGDGSYMVLASSK